MRDRWEPAAARDKVESREVVCLDEEKPEVKPGADTDKIIAVSNLHTSLDRGIYYTF